MTTNQKKTYREALCKRNKLCNFQVVENTKDYQSERCRYCNKKLTFKKIEGYVHSERYRRAHIRAFVQAYTRDHNIFVMVHGAERVKSLLQDMQAEEQREDQSKARDEKYEQQLDLIFNGRKYL